MGYIDDLDQDAMNALNELNDGFSSLDFATSVEVPPEIDHLIQSSTAQTATQNKKPVSKAAFKTGNMDYLFRFTGPITATLISSAAILSSQPTIMHGESEDGPAEFCLVPSSDMQKVKAWLSSTYPNLTPTFAPINKACKALSATSAYPTLGLDTILPQHRPQSLDDGRFEPVQEEFPVVYFFYGTLADEGVLAQLFDTDISGVLRPAHIYGGRIRTWGGKYKALLDCPGSQVDGWAYEVVSKDDEDALCVYETAKYEVVRVDIVVEGRGVVKGCTFRFAGEEGDLA
jgi:hypothetical protein